MPTNIEIKARLLDPIGAKALARQLSGGEGQLIRQRDTFFECATGRLKLRQFSDEQGELIFYRRKDIAGSKQSDYTVVSTDSPGPLCALLTDALTTKATVSKQRLLYIVGQTRVHLDEVDGLGSFLELEV